MSKTIRIGMIGCGQIAQSHMNNYSKMSRDDVQIIAAADISEQAVLKAAGTYNIPHTYTDLHEMLQRDDIDAVDVCLHNNFHRGATEAALNAGKHVYCEKPIAGSYADGVAMLKAAKKAGKNLHIQLAQLYSNETRAAKELIDGGHLGEVYHGRATGFRRRGRPFVDGYGTPTFVQKRNSAGGALYDMGVYHISQMLYLLGNPKVERVTGKIYQKTDMDEARRQQSGYDVEELGMGFVRFGGDLTMDLIESWAVHLDNFEGPSIVGTKGGVRLQPFGYFTSIGDLNLNSTVDLGNASFRWNVVRGNGAFYSSSQGHWIAALQGKVELLPTAEIALNTMLISEAIYMSDSLRREVTAEEVEKASQSTAIKV